MPATQKITQRTAQRTAGDSLKIPRAEFQTVIGPGITELMKLGSQGLAATGACFTHHLKMSLDLFDFEISVPVRSWVTSTGRAKPSKWPAMKVVRITYPGSYEGLGETWGEFNAWIKKTTSSRRLIFGNAMSWDRGPFQTLRNGGPS